MTDHHINIFPSDEDGGYIADIPDLESCSAFGATPEEALAEYRQALALRPEWPDILGRYALALIRRDHRTPADNQAAEQAALKACQLVSEQDPECLRALAWVYARTERPAKAAETARQAATRAMERKNTVLADCLKREFGPDGAILPAPLASEQAPP